MGPQVGWPRPNQTREIDVQGSTDDAQDTDRDPSDSGSPTTYPHHHISFSPATSRTLTILEQRQHDSASCHPRSSMRSREEWKQHGKSASLGSLSLPPVVTARECQDAGPLPPFSVIVQASTRSPRSRSARHPSDIDIDDGDDDGGGSEEDEDVDGEEWIGTPRPTLPSPIPPHSYSTLPQLSRPPTSPSPPSLQQASSRNPSIRSTTGRSPQQPSTIVARQVPAHNLAEFRRSQPARPSVHVNRGAHQANVTEIFHRLPNQVIQPSCQV